jgi:hypothetical protein
MPLFAQSVLMVRPAAFGLNPQTAGSNVFQQGLPDDAAVHAAALREFDACVDTLRNNGVGVLVYDEPAAEGCPDAVFPNNWFSTHPDGSLILYPMAAPNRRAERRPGAIGSLFRQNGYDVRRVHDFSTYERRGLFLEGTGSLVLDTATRTAYAARSARTSEEVVRRVCDVLQYDPFVFETLLAGRPAYHTNVILAVGDGFAVVCDACLPDAVDRRELCRRLEAGGRDAIRITPGQAARFAANLLCLRNGTGEQVVVLSDTAWRAMTADQRDRISRHARPVRVDVPVIERVGGGGVRCMLAEVFLPQVRDQGAG